MVRWTGVCGWTNGIRGELVVYLTEVVIPRGSGKVVNGERVPLSTDGLEGYVKAIVDLYSTQRTLEGNSNPHPRGKAPSDLLSIHKRQRSKRKRQEYQDRGEGTIQDTYSVDELKRVASHFFFLRSARGLRDRVDLLMGHALMARGETMRKIQLPDLFSMELAHESPSQCIATVVIMDQGKMNQVGRIEYEGLIRHREVQLCPVGALEMYLFWRFQQHGEAFPDMRHRQGCYDVHVINGKCREKEISYTTQANGLKKAMNLSGVVSKKVWEFTLFTVFYVYRGLRQNTGSIYRVLPTITYSGLPIYLLGIPAVYIYSLYFTLR
jgi:hypothetical protein